MTSYPATAMVHARHRLESGEHQIDGYDAKDSAHQIPRQLRDRGMHAFTDANEPEGDDQ